MYWSPDVWDGGPSLPLRVGTHLSCLLGRGFEAGPWRHHFYAGAFAGRSSACRLLDDMRQLMSHQAAPRLRRRLKVALPEHDVLAGSVCTSRNGSRRPVGVGFGVDPDRFEVSPESCFHFHLDVFREWIARRLKNRRHSIQGGRLSMNRDVTEVMSERGVHAQAGCRVDGAPPCRRFGGFRVRVRALKQSTASQSLRGWAVEGAGYSRHGWANHHFMESRRRHKPHALPVLR